MWLIAIIFAALRIHAQQPLFDQNNLRLISSQFKFTEGPSVDAEGNVFFTDQPNNQIWKYGVDGKLSLFMSNAGRANGTYFDKSGKLIICADENNELWSVNQNARHTILFKNKKGEALNGPNDLWIDQKGGIYFTDPYYQRDYWTRKAPEIAGEHVYYLAKGKRKAVLVADSLLRPNGIVGASNGKILYVGDAVAEKVYTYEIQNDGSLANRQLFVAQRSDGMTLDHKGNIYLTGKVGVSIFNSAGILVGQIRIPEQHTANVCFGGKDRNVLFITASKSLYSIPMSVKGIE